MGMVLNYSKIILKSRQQRFSSQGVCHRVRCLHQLTSSTAWWLQAPGLILPHQSPEPDRRGGGTAPSCSSAGVGNPGRPRLATRPPPPVSVFPSPSPIGTPAFAPEPPSPSMTASQPDASAETIFPNTVTLAASRGREFWGDRIQPRALGDTACLESG